MNWLRRKITTTEEFGEPIRAEGHASPDPAVVSHCPGCGSGDLVARSDGNVECLMCKRQFSIAEQPAYSALPGAPGAPAPGPQPDPAAPATTHEMELPPVDPQAAAAAPAFTPPGADAEAPEEGAPPADKPEEPKKENPFAKGGVRYRTDKGANLEQGDYVLHLALRTTAAREAVLGARK